MSTNLTRQINHKTMRKVIGVIAICLAPVTLLLANVDYEINSISATYWTNSGDIFVGSLIAVGFFLAAYNGTGGRDWEFVLSKAAAVFAMGIPLFPTTSDGSPMEPPKWAATLTNLFGVEPHHVHNFCAVSLFACLVAMMWFFSKRAAAKGRPKRSLAYKIIAILMGTGILTLTILLKFILEIDSAILIVEIWGLTFFGFGWLLAGMYSEQDENRVNQHP